MHPFDNFAAKYGEVRARKGRGAFIDILIALIPVIVPLIQDCFKPNAQALRRRFGNRARLAFGIKRTQPDLSWADAFDAADDCFDVADQATDQEIEEFVQCCK